jgi:alpha-galactosidase
VVKIAFIGAGSLEFTFKLARDILTFPLLQDAELALMDIDAERLELSCGSVQRIINAGKYPATVTATTDRAEALEGADAVLVTILAGGVDVWQHDILIPMHYGIDINVGDTRGPAGIFRALRTLPVMLDIAHDVEKYCPDALVLNYTNPMAMLCRGLQRETSIHLTGLCHSVQGTAEMLARWLKKPLGEIDYTCAGINHLAWYIQYRWNGQDAYPLLRNIIEKPEIYNEEIVRNEMFRHLGYYVTESSGHNSEYNWWFRKRPELIEKYCRNGTGWNPGEHAYILNQYRLREQTWRQEFERHLKEDVDIQRGSEYAAYIINAWAGGESFRFNGNVPNRNLITNLPADVCVEVPVIVDNKGLHPIRIGDLPLPCATLTVVNVMVEEMAVEAALAGDPSGVFHAVAYDPLTAAVLSLAETKDMVNDMLVQNKEYLPQFHHYSV